MSLDKIRKSRKHNPARHPVRQGLTPRCRTVMGGKQRLGFASRCIQLNLRAPAIAGVDAINRHTRLINQQQESLTRRNDASHGHVAQNNSLTRPCHTAEMFKREVCKCVEYDGHAFASALNASSCSGEPVLNSVYINSLSAKALTSKTTTQFRHPREGGDPASHHHGA